MGLPFSPSPFFKEKEKEKWLVVVVVLAVVFGTLFPQRAHTPSSTSPSCGHLAKWRYNSGHSPLWINSSPDLLVSASRRVYWQTRNPPKKKKKQHILLFSSSFCWTRSLDTVDPIFFSLALGNPFFFLVCQSVEFHFVMPTV